MSNVAVIGTGLIGRAWTISFARAGHHVRLWSPTPGRKQEALAYIERLLPDLAMNNLLRGSSVDEVLERVVLVDSLEEAVEGCTYVQENALEDVSIKTDLFKRLDANAPAEAILASSTSDIAPSLFTGTLPGRARCTVCHPLNPPYLLPAVEVVPSSWTSGETVTRTVDFMSSLGQSPIVMNQEDQGFVTIRLQGALMQEAFRIVESGLASAVDVDRAIKDGLALRWSVVGPFETIDLNAPNGIREYVERYQDLYARLAEQHGNLVDWAGPVLETIDAERRAALPMSKFAERQLWRDRWLMGIAAQRQQASSDLGW